MAGEKPQRTLPTLSIAGETLKVNVKIIPDSMVATKDVADWCKKGQKMKPCRKLNDGTGKPKGITIHNSGNITVASGTNMAEQYTRATYNGNMLGVVVHYYVWHGEIWQNLDDTEQGWHAADQSSRRKDHRGGQTGGNVDTIAIECIGPDPETEETAAKLAAYLCKVYGLNPVLDIYTHNYWMYSKDEIVQNARKNCPLYIILPHWDEFVGKVKGYYDKDQALSAPPEDDKLYKVQLGAFKNKANAEKLEKELKAKGYDTYITTS